MSCQVLFTDTANADLRDIAYYIADAEKDRNVAIRFVKRLQERTRILEQFPESGAIPKDRVLRSNGYRSLTYKDYLLFYQHQENENIAYIVAIFNGKRDYMRIMKKYME